ncbi:MAG: L-threonylcarbamoyladenylate synthase [Pseudomonadota bacterium]
MKTLPLHLLLDDPTKIRDVTRVLDEGGLVCLPCGGTYRIVADLTSETAVNHLFASKGRTQKAPSLVFVDSEKMLAQVVAEVSPLSQRLARHLWPGPLTILFPAHPDLPAKVVKQLVRANGKIGVRIPDDPVVRQVLTAFGHPLLVSSANKQRKQGAASPAQIRKNFVGRVDLFVEDGDLASRPASTVVSLDGERVSVTRAGALSEEQISAAAG